MKRTVIIIAVIVAVLAVFVGAMVKNAPKPAAPTTEEIWKNKGIPVETSLVERGDIEQAVEITGDINALDSVTLSAKISGRVAAVYAREGDPVSKGQVIVVLDQDDALSNLRNAQGGYESAKARLSQARTNAKVTKIQTDTAIQQAQSALEQVTARLAVTKNPSRNQDRMVAENRLAAAKASLDNKEADYKRYKKLLDRGAVSESSFDVAKTAYTIAQTDYKSAEDQLSLIKEGGRSEDITTAQAAVSVAREQLRSAKANASQNLLRAEDVKSAVAALQQARAAVDLAKQQLSYTYIKSPISGVASSRTTEPGQVVSPGQALVGVVNLGSVYFKGNVSEKEIVNISRDQKAQVTVDAIPGKTFDGVISEIYPAGSSLSRYFPVRVTIVESKNMIKPSMYARARIVIGTAHNALLVPKDAVEERKGTKLVFTLDAKGVAKRHDVEVIRENSHLTQIAEMDDLQPGDAVVTRGRQSLQDGSKARVEK